jgi:hypothetical protein
MRDFQSEINAQSKLIELLNLLTPAEKAQIPQFCALSVVNKGRMRAQVWPLLEICLKHPWHEADRKLLKTEVFAALFPGEDFSVGKLDKVLVDALKVLRHLLIAQKYYNDDNEFQQTLDYYEVVKVRNAAFRTPQFLERLGKIQNQNPIYTTEYYYNQFLLEQAIHDDASFFNQFKSDLNIPITIEALDFHFQLCKLELLNRFLIQQKIAKLTLPENLSQLIESHQLPAKYKDLSPTIMINDLIFRALQQNFPEEDQINELFDLLKKHGPQLTTASLKEFYSYLRNLCTLFSSKNMENEQIRHTLFELYQDNLARGYLHYEGKLHPSVYLNVCLVAVRVRQYEWVNAFIENHKHEIIGENETQDFYRLNKANYYFGKGEFEKSLDMIPPTSPSLDYQLQGKRLELKAMYELQSDFLNFKLDSFKMYMSRTSVKFVSKVQQKANLDFVNFLAQIIASVPGDKKRSAKLVERINQNKQALEWLWLLTKAREIAKAR